MQNSPMIFPFSPSMAEIEALLDLSENNQILDENDALLRMLESAETKDEVSFSKEPEEAMEVDLEELDALLSPEEPAGENKGKEKSKEKKVKGGDLDVRRKKSKSTFCSRKITKKNTSNDIN